ncbi:MAG TPA: oligopeptide transporter, OPT family [Phycisphaerae bacterium]|nr:oligopeptide transporter, OPT family [Phycisphaerae bacterium]
MSDPVVATRLPENAYRELKPGEAYTPMVPPYETVPEVTRRSIIFGIIMNVVFAMAATYLALKAGQGIETAIPISILAVGLSGVLARFGHRRSSLLENVNILAIGTTSGIVAGGTCFTMPAIYMLGLDTKLGMGTFGLFLQIFLVPFLGAALGVVFMVPFRRYFVRDMHGKLPFPEGTATNEILATGASGNTGQAWVLIYSFVLAAAYNFCSMALKLFTEVFTTGRTAIEVGKETFTTLAIPKLERITEGAKAVFNMGTGAYYLGLGYIIGLRYATIIACGSFLSCFVIVPLFAGFELEQLRKISPTMEATTPKALFEGIPKIIGIGGIFTAGILSIIKMSKVIATALVQAIGSLFKRSSTATVDRTDEDIGYPALFGLAAVLTVALFVYFRFVVMSSLPDATRLAAISTAVALVLSFLFTTVSAWAIAMISTTPLSGMTVTTIIITAALLTWQGLPKGDSSMLAVLLVGGVVCTALSMAGTMVTQFKIGYWIGASPRKIQWSGIIASFLAAILVTIVIMVLAYKPGYVATTQPGVEPLPAPQANMMKSALETFLGKDAVVPWTLYGTGAVIAIILLFLGISPLAFSLGMYLPMFVNTPLLIGGLIAHFIAKGSKDEAVNKARNDKGVLIASGLIAGAAIIEVSCNALAIFDEKFVGGRIMPWLDMTESMMRGRTPEQLAQFKNWLGLGAFGLLSLLMFLDCRRTKPAAA